MSETSNLEIGTITVASFTNSYLRKVAKKKKKKNMNIYLLSKFSVSFCAVEVNEKIKR